MNPTLLFVHGFKGSSASFSQFPIHITAQLQQSYNILHFEHSSQGTARKLVDDLCDFIVRLVASPWVVIVAHSLGGLMAVDSVRNLVSKGRVVFGERSAGIPGRIWIRGLISFDSPFFGLQSGAITGTVTRQLSKAKEYYQSYNRTSISRSNESSTTSSAYTFAKWAGVAAMVGGVAAVASRSTAVQSIVSQQSQNIAQSLGFANQFLSNKQDMMERLDFLKSNAGNVKLFYIKLSKRISVIDNQFGPNKEVTTFINLPPNEYMSIFIPIDYQEIGDDGLIRNATDCHTSIFKQEFDVAAYVFVLENVVEFLKNLKY